MPSSHRMNIKVKNKPMKNLNAEFYAGAVSPDSFPAFPYQEAAFAGRSNVGKSSLLNSIVNRKNLARTSSTPGKTQQINFYIIEKKWSFADLPGFGYAAIGKKERLKWRQLNLAYLEKRENLKLTCCLVDSRHDPMEHDLGLMELLEEWQRDFIVILTKCDKLSPKKITERKNQLENVVQNCRHIVEVLPYSSITGLGRNELSAVLKKYLT